MERIINRYQSGGLKNRCITNNLAITRNIINNIAPNHAGAILALDFEKAYDKIDRKNIYQIMERLKLPKTFIENVKTLYDNSSFCIKINGTLSRKVNIERGIKQGCPLAMYLYILYIEPLHRKIQNCIQGIRIGSAIIKTNKLCR